MTPGQEAAAFHGIAISPVHPVPDRLQAAKQALAWYEAEVERLRIVVEAVRIHLHDAIDDLDGNTS